MKTEYTPPEIEVTEYAVENGFAQSYSSGGDDDYIIDTIPDDPHNPHNPHHPHWPWWPWW